MTAQQFAELHLLYPSLCLGTYPGSYHEVRHPRWPSRRLAFLFSGGTSKITPSALDLCPTPCAMLVRASSCAEETQQVDPLTGLRGSCADFHATDPWQRCHKKLPRQPTINLHSSERAKMWPPKRRGSQLRSEALDPSTLLLADLDRPCYEFVAEALGLVGPLQAAGYLTRSTSAAAIEREAILLQSFALGWLRSWYVCKGSCQRLRDGSLTYATPPGNLQVTASFRQLMLKCLQTGWGQLLRKLQRFSNEWNGRTDTCSCCRSCMSTTESRWATDAARP